MSNGKYYKNTFDEVHVPEAVLRKVKGMKMEEKKIQKRSKLYYAVAAVAAVGLCVLASNGICYAATGNTWVEKAILYVNGEKVEQNINWYNDGDTVYGELEYTVENEDESGSVIFYDSEGEAPDLNVEEGVEFSSIYTYSDVDAEGMVIQENDRLYLYIDGDKIDITEDMADGECSGSFEKEGITYEYVVTGNGDNYTVTIK